MNIETLLTLLGSNLIVAVFSYFTGKRKTDVETDNTILAGLEQSVSIYRDIIEDLRKEIEKLNQKINDLETKIDELHKENKMLKTNL
jgi:peptidoglycan hydrolase CwlO-like protein